MTAEGGGGAICRVVETVMAERTLWTDVRMENFWSGEPFSFKRIQSFFSKVGKEELFMVVCDFQSRWKVTLKERASFSPQPGNSVGGASFSPTHLHGPSQEQQGAHGEPVSRGGATLHFTHTCSLT